jgi:uncharacterized phage protein (TIGR02218 family)
MKSASAATLAILSSGQFYRADMYDITLKGGGTYRFTTAEALPPVGGNTYATNLMIKRGSISQKAGLQIGSLDISIAPQFDDPGGGPIVGGLPILKACSLGLLDNADVLMSKIFLSSWTDTSPGAVPWWRGSIDKVTPGRRMATLSCNNVISQLNLPMPRNVYQSACLHALFDTGCGLVKATYTNTGAVSGTPTNITFNTGLTQADGYFDLGVITFTSGANNGLSRTIKSFLHTSGVVTMIYPLPSVPTAGDTFSIVPGCDKLQATCASKFSNTIHFRGYPYIPNPETPYDGGAANVQAAPTTGGQKEIRVGSGYSGNSKQITYVP